MGKRSQAKGRWPSKARELHTFSDRVSDVFYRTFRVVSRGLTRPDTQELRKRREQRQGGT